MHVELRIEARDDLTEAAAFYEDQRDGLGDHFIDSLFADLARLESESGIHEIVYGLHRKLSKQFPFTVYYRVVDQVIEVVAVLDCRRDPDAIKQRLGHETP